MDESTTDNNSKQRFRAIIPEMEQQMEQYEENNMTFSEAKQTDYQNLSEFRKIQIENLASIENSQSTQKQFQNQKEVQISAQNPQSKSALANPAGNTLNSRNKNDMAVTHNKSQMIQQFMDFPHQGIHQPLQRAMDEQRIQQNVTELELNSGLPSRNSIGLVEQKQLNNQLAHGSASMVQSTRAAQMMNNLRTKGQIKLHKGLKKNYQVVTSKQNSQPPSKCSSKVDSNSLFNVPKLSVSSIKNTVQKQMYQKRQSLGGPAKSNAYQVINNLSIGQIIAGPIQIKNKRKSIQSNKTGGGGAPSKSKKKSSSKKNSLERQKMTTDRSSKLQIQQQQQQQQQQINNFVDGMVQSLIQTNIIDSGAFANQQNNMQMGLHSGGPPPAMTTNFVNMPPNTSFKKIRKQSHIKHNSIDRAHTSHNAMPPKSIRQQKNMNSLVSNLVSLDSQREQLHLDKKLENSIKLVPQGQSRDSNHTLKGQSNSMNTNHGMGVIKKLIQQQNIDYNLLDSQDPAKKIMRSFDENPKKKSLTGNTAGATTVLVNVQKQVKNAKNFTKKKSQSITSQKDAMPDSRKQKGNKTQTNMRMIEYQMTQKQLQMKSFHVQERMDQMLQQNVSVNEISPVNARSVIYATQDHCNSKIIKKEQQKTAARTIKKLNQNLLNVINEDQTQVQLINQSQNNDGAGNHPVELNAAPKTVKSGGMPSNRAAGGHTKQPSKNSGSYGQQVNSGGNSGGGTGGSHPTNQQLSQNNISSSVDVSGPKSIYKSFDQHRVENQKPSIIQQDTRRNKLGADLVGSYSMSMKSGLEEDIDMKLGNQFGTLGMKSSSHQLEGIPQGSAARFTKEQIKQSILMNQRVQQMQQMQGQAPQQPKPKVKSHRQGGSGQPNNILKNQMHTKSKSGSNNDYGNQVVNIAVKKRSQPSDGGEGTGAVYIQQLSYGKSAISSQKSKKTNKGGVFQLYSTEDNRSSFTGIIKGNGKSKKSSGGGNLNSGSGSGNHYATMNAGLQNKTSSSKNTNTFRKTRRKRETNAQSGEYANVVKKGNFLDEFSQFEEQFEKNQLRQKEKLIVNDKIAPSNELPNANKKAPAKEKKPQKQEFNILNQLQIKDDDGLFHGKKKLSTSFIKSASSDGLISMNYSNQNPGSNENNNPVPNLQNQNQIEEQYDSYMRDFQAVTNKLMAQKKIIDSQRNCQQCDMYLQLYLKNQMKKSGNQGQMNELEMAQNNALNDESQYLGTYKGHEYQHIQHNLMTLPSGPGQGKPLACYCPFHQQQILQEQNQNQIVSQSKVIIPRGIVNFKKVHSLSVERRNNNLLDQNNASQFIRPNNGLNVTQSQPPRQPDRSVESRPPNRATQINIQGIQGTTSQSLLPMVHQNSARIDNQDRVEEDNQQQQITLFAAGTGEAGVDYFSNDEQEQPSMADLLPKLNMYSSVQSQESQSFFQNQSTFNQQGTFLLEPRDESLMRKKKVIEILKTFQEQDEGSEIVEKKNGSQNDSKGNKEGNNNNNFGEDVNNAQNQKQKRSPNVPLLQSFLKDPKNHTYQVGKPIIIKQQNRVKNQKNPKNMRRRDQLQPEPPIDKKAGGELTDCGDNLMSDLNEFIMCQDHKIDEQEEKFMQQSRKNQEQMFNQMFNQQFGDEDKNEQDLETDELDLANDLGLIDYSRELGSKQIITNQIQEFFGQRQKVNSQDVCDQPSGDSLLSPLSYEGDQHQQQNMLNLQSQIKNIDSIFEPEGTEIGGVLQPGIITNQSNMVIQKKGNAPSDRKSTTNEQ